MRRIVCGLPAPGGTTMPSRPVSALPEMSSPIWATSRRIAVAVVAPANRATMTIATTKRGHMPRDALAGRSSKVSALILPRASRSSPLRSTALDRLQVPAPGGVALQPAREAEDELGQGQAVAGQGGDRHPFVGPVVAAAARAELDGGDPGLEEGDRVRGAVAPDAEGLAVPPAHRGAQRAHVRVGRGDDGRRPDEGPGHLDVGDGPDLGQQVTRVLPGEVTDVNGHLAVVWDLVDDVPAVDPPEVDRGAVEELGGLAGEGHGLDSPE